MSTATNAPSARRARPAWRRPRSNKTRLGNFVLPRNLVRAVIAHFLLVVRFSFVPGVQVGLCACGPGDPGGVGGTGGSANDSSSGVIVNAGPVVVSTGGSSGNPHEEKCKNACSNEPGTPCYGSDATTCTSDCVAAVSAYPFGNDCADCIIEHSGWRGTLCVHNYNGGCYSCYFPMMNPCLKALGGTSCECNSQYDKCDDYYVIAKPDSSACAGSCGK